MSKNTTKLPRNQRYRDQSKATAKIVEILESIADITSELRPALAAAEWDEICSIIAVRVFDATTPILVQAHNDDIQAGRDVGTAQRKRISAAVGSPIVVEWVNGKKPCKNAAVIKTMMEKRDITSLYSLRKALAGIAKEAAGEKSDVEIADDLDKENQTARSQLKINDGGRVNGLQSLHDGWIELAEECASLDPEDIPILKSELHKAIQATLKASDTRQKKIEAADHKAEKKANRKAT